MKNYNTIITKLFTCFSSGKTDKYKYLTGEEILPTDQSQLIEHTKFTYFTLGKALKKLIKKQIEALKSLKPSNKIDELKQIESIFTKTSWMIWFLISWRNSSNDKVISN